MSISSLRAHRSRRLRPPSLVGFCSCSSAILGEESSSHMKFQIVLVSAASMCGGMPCAFVRNWVYPPTTSMIWMIAFLPFIVGWVFFHLSRFLCVLSTMGSQGVASFVLFPIHAPRDLTASPSSAIYILPFSGFVSSWLIFRVTIIRCLWASEPIGIISVLSMLNFAPETWHQVFRIIWAWSKRSSWLRYRLVSSAKRFVLIGSSSLGILISFRLWSDRIIHASGSIPMSNIGHDSGSPCRMPLVILKGSLSIPFIMTCVFTYWYSVFIVFMNVLGRLNTSRVLHR
jgi:hypothetical protein